MPRSSVAIDPSLPAPLVPPLDDEAALIQLIADIQQREPLAVWRELCSEELELGQAQRAAAEQFGLTWYHWTDASVAFYEQRDSLIGQATWNRRPTKLQLRRWLGSFLKSKSPSEGPPLRVLSVGDGAGFESLYLAQCGHSVTYNDAARRNVEFAQRIFADAGVSVRHCSQLSELTPGEFDALVCLDVLEHVPDPPGFLSEMLSYLRPGGWLIVHAPFYFVTHHNPSHLAANRRYAGDLRLYEDRQLMLEDGLPSGNPLVFLKQGGGVAPSPARAAQRRRIRLGARLFRLSRWIAWPFNYLAAQGMQQRDPAMLARLEAAQP